MENLSLIDVSLEDDLLISSSETYDGHNCSLLEPANASEGENLLKMTKPWNYMPEKSESPEQKRAKSGKVNLRKSLAWDSAFFTNEGVLNTEELATVNSMFRKTEASSLPGIQEELRKSTESTSTLDNESYTLENLEADLFNLRSSIQMSVNKHDNCLSGDGNASQLGSRKKVELPSHTKINPSITLKRDGVSKQRLECTSKAAVIGGKEAAKGSENTKLLLKPPRIVHKPTSGSIQMKTNGRKTSAGNGANQRDAVTFSKTTVDSRGTTSRSISLPKPTPSRPNTMVFSSNSSPTSSSSHPVKSPLENSRKRTAVRNNNGQSLSGPNTRTPTRTPKTKVGPSNFKFSSKASPSSSIDSFVSEGSSSTSTTIKPSNSVESLSSATSSSPSVVSIEQQPCIKKDVPSNRLQSQTAAKGSLGTRLLSEPHHAIRSSTSSNTGAKSFKPSGLRMPSPKIGYFDAERTLVSKNPNNLPKIGVRSSLAKFSRIPSLRPAAQTNSCPVNAAQATFRVDKEEKHVANETDSVSDKIQKENVLPTFESDDLVRHSSNEGEKTSAVDVVEEKMSSLSLFETPEPAVGD